MNQPVKKWALSGMSDEEKAETIKRLPAGAVLFFSGHEMIYLGENNGKLYVISSLGNIVLDGDVTAVRGGIINTLDMKRGTGATWLRSMTQAQIPYLPAGAKKDMSDNDITVSGLKTLTYNGEYREPAVKITDNAGTLALDADYTVSYSNNKNAGKASVTITAKSDSADYTGSVTKTFTIKKASNTLAVKGQTAKIKYSALKKKAQTIPASKAYKFTSRGQGKITYSKISGSKKISINGSNGKVTVKKKTKKGTYKVSVWVKAAGDANHFSAKKKVTFKIKVK